MKVRVRFAPSPTGPLHIGGVRTALYNYLFAKKHGGDFILRIEDTDRNRYVEGAEKYIIDSLLWCGLKPDEGPDDLGGNCGHYRQSERRDMYRQYVMELIEKGWAYYAFDTAEQLEALRKEKEQKGETFIYNFENRKKLDNSLTLGPEEVEKKLASGINYAVRFKIPENELLEMNDIIRGRVRVHTREIDDKVLYKSDGMPTYHLANIVDDHLMLITHVIRGEEWLPSLPLHVLLYKAFGWEAPKFAHLPLILKPEGPGKLSKRDGDALGFPVFPLNFTATNGEVYKGYREEGYLKDAFINMLALLGWNDSPDKEIYSINELTEAFSLEKVSKSGARFSPKKAIWFQQQYMHRLSDAEFYSLAKDYLPDGDQAYNQKVCSLIKERCTFAKDIVQLSDFFYNAPQSYDEKVVEKYWKEGAAGNLMAISGLLHGTPEQMHDAVMGYMEKNSLNMGQTMNCFRLALVGRAAGPGLFEIVGLIGAEEAKSRIEKACRVLR